jgi:hypothetical protein
MGNSTGLQNNLSLGRRKDMPEYQTTVQNDLNILRGNGLVEVSRYKETPEWFNVGAITDLVAEEELTISAEENHNTDSEDRVTKQRLKITFNQLEPLNLDVWEIMRAGDDYLDTITMNSDQTTIKSGNRSSLPVFMTRITTKNDGKQLVLTGFKCNLTAGFNWCYKADDDEDRRMPSPIELICKPDTLYNADAEGNGFVYSL